MSVPPPLSPSPPFVRQASKDALDRGLRAEEDAAAASQVSLEGVRAVLQSAAVSSATLHECEEAVRRDVVAPLLHRLQEEQRQRQMLLRRLGQLQVGEKGGEGRGEAGGERQEG